MGHIIDAKEEIYQALAERLSKTPEGAPIKLKIILDGMSDKGLVLDIPRKDSFYYILTPMLIGFFEYTFMRTGNHATLKELAELFETYFHSEGVMKR